MSMSKTILVVDDEEDVRELLAHYLRRAGHDVVGAKSGQEGLSFLRLQSFDCVITDIAMPDTSGQDLIKAIKAGNKVPPKIIVLSAYSDMLEEDPCIKSADKLVSKPVDLKSFVKDVNKFLGVV